MNFELQVSKREDKGRGASRRLRRQANKIPAVIYGGTDAALSIEIDHDQILHALENEAFYSHILTLHIDGSPQQAILKDLQRHPFKPKILHADFLRVSKDQMIRVHIPIHFIGEDIAVGVKEQGGVISHLLNQIEVECLPALLPEFIEVNVSKLALDESIHLSQLSLAKGLVLVDLMGNDPDDKTIVSIYMPRIAVEPELTDADSLSVGDAAEGQDASADDKGKA